MKKISLLIALISLASSFTYAQQGFHVGVVGNFNTTWIVNQEAYHYKEYDYKLDLGGGGGVQIGYNITDHIGFLAEIKSSSQGQKYADHDSSSHTRQVKLNYTAIPILFKFIGGEPESTVKFYAQAGIQYNILNSGTILDNTYPGLNNVDAKPRYNSSDLGVNFGLGADIKLASFLYLSAGMSFYYSFSDINAPSWRLPDRSNVYKASRNGTGGISVGIHYLLPTGGN